jgi:O-Antigen ligase
VNASPAAATSARLATTRPRSDLWAARDEVPLGVVGQTVFVLVATYIILDRLIPDELVLPMGFSIRLYEVILMILGVVWLTWIAVEPHPFPYGLAGLAGLAVFAIFGLAPFINGPTLTRFETDGAERGLFALFTLTVLFLASYHLAFRLRVAKRLLVVVVIATLVQAVIGIYEFLTKTPFDAIDNFWLGLGLVPDPNSIRPVYEGIERRDTGEIRAVATAPHPIVLSAVIALAILLVGLWILNSHDRRKTMWLSAAALVLVLALPVASSRTGFVIIAFAVIPMIIASARKAPRLILWSVPLFGALIGSVIVSPRFPRLLLNSITDSNTDQNTTIRVERFQRIPQLLESRPFIGAGYQTKDPSIQIFDNAFNNMIIELGIIGLIAFLLFLVSAIVFCWRAVERATSDEILLPLCGVLSVLALLAGGATFDAWTFEQFFPTAIILLGIGMGRSSVILKRESHRAESV